MADNITNNLTGVVQSLSTDPGLLTYISAACNMLKEKVKPEDEKVVKAAASSLNKFCNDSLKSIIESLNGVNNILTSLSIPQASTMGDVYNSVKDTIGSLNNYNDTSIPLLASAQVPKYKTVKKKVKDELGNEVEVTEQVQDGYKPDVLADALVSKVTMASNVIKKYADALRKEENSKLTGGLQFNLNGLQTAVEQINNITGVDTNTLAQTSNSVKDIIGSLNNYNDTSIPLLASAQVPKYKTVKKKVKDELGNEVEVTEQVQDGYKPDVLADALVSKVTMASNVIKKYTDALRKEENSKLTGGLQFNLNGLQTAVEQINNITGVDTNTLAQTSNSVKDIIGSLNNYNDTSIPLLASAQVPKYKTVKKKVKDELGNEVEVTEQVQDGYKPDVLADALVSKIIIASNVIKKYTDALRKEENSKLTGGLQFNLNGLQNAVEQINNITGVDTNTLAQTSNSVKDIIGSLNNYNDTSIPLLASAQVPKYKTVKKKVKDELGNEVEVTEQVQDGYKPDVLADALVSKIIIASNVIKKYADALRKEENSKLTGGLQFNLNSLQTAVEQINGVTGVDTNTLAQTSNSVKDIIGSLNNYNDTSIPLLASAQVPKYKTVKKKVKDELGNEVEVTEQVQDGYKPDVLADALVSKVIIASNIIKKYADALRKEENSKLTGGLQFNLNNLQNAIEQTNKSVVNTQGLGTIFTTVKGVLDSLTPYGNIELLNCANIKIMQPKKDADNKPMINKDDGSIIMEEVTKKDTLADVYVAKIVVASAVVKKLSDSIFKKGENGSQDSGLIPNLNSLNMALGTKLDYSNLKSGFETIKNTLLAITGGMVEIGGLYDKDAGKLLQESVESLLGYTTIDKDEEGNEKKDEAGKVKTTAHTGVFAVVNTFTKSVQKLFQENGTFDLLSKIDFNKIDSKHVQGALDKATELMDMIIKSLKDHGVESDEKRLLAMCGEEYLQKIQNITSSVNSILQAITDMADPKKNPLIGNPVKIILVRRKIKKTFEALVGVINIIISEMEALVNILQDKKMDDINKAYEDISKVFTTVNNILKAIIEMPKLMLKFIPAAIVVMIGLVVFGLFLGVLWLELKLISLIKFNQISKDLAPLTKLFKDLTNIFKDIEQLAIHVTIAALAFIPMLVAGLLILQGLGILILVIKAMIWMISFLNPKHIQNAHKRLAGLNGLLWSIISLSLTMVLLAIVIIPATVGSLVVIAGLFIMSFVFKGIIELINAMAESVNMEMIVNIAKIILVLGAMCIVLLAFMGMAIILLTMQNTVTQLRFGPIALFIGSMIALAALLVGLGAALSSATPVLVPAAAIVGVAVGAMLAILLGFMGMAKVLEEIQNTKLDIKVIKETATNIFTASKDVCLMAIDVAKLISINDIKQAKKTIKKMRRLVKQVGEIAETLNKVNEIKLDGNLIESNVKVIFLTANQVVSSIGNEDGTGISPETIEKNGAQFKLTLVAFNIIFDDLNKLVKILDDVQKVKLDGKVITDSINVVFQTANEIIEKIVNNENVSLDKLKEDKKEFDKISNQYKAIFEDFTKLTDILAGVDLEKFKNQTNGGFVGIITDIAAASKKLEGVDGEKINKTLNSYGDFLKKVDNVNLKKLETSAKVFEEMAKFSESINGNFDKMADTLNEKIGPLLEDLKNTLNDVHIQVTENGAQAQANTDRIVEKQEIREQMRASGQTQNLTVEEVDRRIDRKYQENVQQRYGIDEIASKLATLIDLFQSGEALVKTT